MAATGHAQARKGEKGRGEKTSGLQCATCVEFAQVLEETQCTRLHTGLLLRHQPVRLSVDIEKWRSRAKVSAFLSRSLSGKAHISVPLGSDNEVQSFRAAGFI